MSAVEWTPEQAALLSRVTGAPRAGTKYCPKCSTTKPCSEFHIHRRKADGLQDRCKRCMTQSTTHRARAASRARERLVAAHKDEYDRYYTEEKAKVGL